MDLVCKKIYDIKEKPIVYIGKKSVVLLRAYISGYIDRVKELNPEFKSVFWNFGDYVTEYYGVTLNMNWDRILTAYTSTDEDAFDMFYTLLDEFLKKDC